MLQNCKVSTVFLVLQNGGVLIKQIQEIRTAGDRDIAQMNMYAGMMQAMGF